MSGGDCNCAGAHLPPCGLAIGAAKHDGGKDRWDLLPLTAAREVVRVLTYGANKYAPDAWKRVPEARERYYAATMRHLFAWRQGESRDAESGHLHLAHAACCLFFLLWFEIGMQVPLAADRRHP